MKSSTVIDNGRGKGSGRFDPDGQPLFWFSSDCPLHAEKEGSDNDRI